MSVHATHTQTKLVRWKDFEVMSLAGEIIRISRKEHKDPLQHRSYFRTIFDAQRVLPENRRRKMDSIQASKTIEPFTNAIKLILEQEKRAAEAREQEAREQEAKKVTEAQSAPTVNPLSQPHGNGPASPAGDLHPQPTSRLHVVPNVHATPEQKEEPINVGEHLNPPSKPFIPKQVEAELPSDAAMGSLDEMIKLAGQMIGNTLVDAFMQTLQTRMATELPKLALRAMSISKTLPKILVIGPLPKQQPALEEAVDGVVELKFVSSEERASLVQSRGKYCVGAVVWSGFVSHSHSDAVRRLYNNDNIRIVTGTNLETLKAAVEEIAIQIAN